MLGYYRLMLGMDGDLYIKLGVPDSEETYSVFIIFMILRPGMKRLVQDSFTHSYTK